MPAKMFVFQNQKYCYVGIASDSVKYWMEHTLRKLFWNKGFYNYKLSIYNLSVLWDKGISHNAWYWENGGSFRSGCPANVYPFKVKIETLEKGVKNVQN